MTFGEIFFRDKSVFTNFKSYSYKKACGQKGLCAAK